MNRDDQYEADLQFDAGEGRYQGRRETSGKAIASFILGGASFLFSILTAIPAIILGIISLKQIKASRGRVGGETLAICGVIMGGLGGLMFPILIAMLLPALATVREKGREVASKNNMSQINRGMMVYSEDAGFPAAANQGDGKPDVSWRTQLLPYLEESGLAEQYDYDSPWDSAKNKRLSTQNVPIFQSPNLEKGTGKTNYLVLRGEQTAFPPGRRTKFFKDGASRTILFVEADEERAVPWSKPQDIDYDASRPLAGLGNLRPRTILVSMGDFSVRSIPSDIDPKVFHALVTPAGRENVDLDEVFERRRSRK